MSEKPYKQFSRRVAGLAEVLRTFVLRYDAPVATEHTSVDALLRRVDDFFMAQGPVHKTMRALAQRLTLEGIDYALVGGMALVLYGYRRETVAVDVVLSNEGREVFIKNLVGRGYAPLFPGAQKAFRDTATGIEIDVIDPYVRDRYLELWDAVASAP